MPDTAICLIFNYRDQFAQNIIDFLYEFLFIFRTWILYDILGTLTIYFLNLIQELRKITIITLLQDMLFYAIYEAKILKSIEAFVFDNFTK